MNLCVTGPDLRFRAARRCAPRAGVARESVRPSWLVAFPVEPADELTVDLAGGVELFGAPGEFLAEQRLFDFG
jgi:hypothetical protein